MKKSKTTVVLVRGCYANPYELQNYYMPTNKYKIIVAQSVRSLDYIQAQTKQFISPADFANILGSFYPLMGQACRYLFRRTIGCNRLFGLSSLLKYSGIIHTADPHYYFSYQSAVFAKRHSIPLILTYWETIAHNNESIFKKKQRKIYVIKNADAVLCHTKKSLYSAIKDGVKQKNLYYIPLGIDTKRFKPAKKPISKTVYLYASRLVQEKGIADFLKALRLVYQQNTNIHAYIIGKGFMLKYIKKYIRLFNLKKIVSLKNVSYKEMPNYYQKSSVLVMPSQTTNTWEEQYGMVLLEAMASRLPIISTNTGAIPEVVGKSALLVPEKNSNALALSMIKIAQSKSLALKLGTIGYERVKKYYTIGRFQKKLTTVYEKLLSHSFST